MTDNVKTQLCPAIEVLGTLDARILASFSAAVTSIILAAGGGVPFAAPTVGPWVEQLQREGIAVLIEGDARLARIIKADGVHIPVSDTAEASYREAREILGARAIIGVDAGRSRHDAMTLAEAGADYVGFGIPDFVTDRARAGERRLELIDWWAEVVVVPCMALDIEDAAAARALAAAGADFLSIRIKAGEPVEESVRRLADLSALTGDGDGEG